MLERGKPRAANASQWRGNGIKRVIRLQITFLVKNNIGETDNVCTKVVLKMNRLFTIYTDAVKRAGNAIPHISHFLASLTFTFLNCSTDVSLQDYSAEQRKV